MAQDEVIEQGGGSSSSTPPHPTTLTPLAYDAREFIRIWETTPRLINEEDPLQIYEGYINQIIEADNFQKFSPSDPFNPLPTVPQNFFTEENREARKNVFTVLLRA